MPSRGNLVDLQIDVDEIVNTLRPLFRRLSTELQDRVIVRTVNRAGSLAHTAVVRELAKRTGAGRREVRANTIVQQANLSQGASYTIRVQSRWLSRLVNLITVGDERVCPICSAIARNGPYTEIEAEGIHHPYSHLPGIAHPNCFLPGTLIRGRVQVALKSRYSGPAIEVITRNSLALGRDGLCVTAQHPILTERGFIPAQELTEGMQLLSKGRDIGREACSGPYHHNRGPAVVEKIFQSFQATSTASCEVSDNHFHGDGKFIDGNVHIKFSNSGLLRDRETKRAKGLGQFGFKMSDIHGGSLQSARPSSFGGFGVDTTATCGLCGMYLFTPSTYRHTGPFDGFGFGLIPELDFVKPQEADNGPATYAKFLSELVDRGTGAILADEVIGVRKFDFHGHVYDLQTDSGWLIAQGIVVSNCRCHWEPVSADVERRMRRQGTIAEAFTRSVNNNAYRIFQEEYQAALSAMTRGRRR